MNSKRGITLIETLVSMAVLGVLAVAAVRALSVAAATRALHAESLEAMSEARMLMDATLLLGYDDLPATSAEVAPIGVSEVSGGRAVLESVDTSEQSAAVRRRNTATVTLVAKANPALAVTADEGVKRVEVVVWKGGRELARLVQLRTRSADEARP